MYFEGICVLYRSSKRLHMKRWKSEMLQNYLENTWLDGRNAANSVQIRGWTSEMLQIACKTEGLGHHLADHTIGGGVAARRPAPYIHIMLLACQDQKTGIFTLCRYEKDVESCRKTYQGLDRVASWDHLSSTEPLACPVLLILSGIGSWFRYWNSWAQQTLVILRVFVPSHCFLW